jgi:hypothetical protein
MKHVGQPNDIVSTRDVVREEIERQIGQSTAMLHRPGNLTRDLKSRSTIRHGRVERGMAT